LLGVSARYIARTVDQGGLPGAFRLPPSGEGIQQRRIPSSAVVAFCRSNGSRVPAELTCGPPVAALVAGLSEDERNSLAVAIPEVALRFADSAAQAGYFGAALGPNDAAMLDANAIGRTETLGVAEQLRRVQGVRRIVVVPTEDDASIGPWKASGCQIVMPRPLDLSALSAILAG
jgi:hypothetical protein